MIQFPPAGSPRTDAPLLALVDACPHRGAPVPAVDRAGCYCPEVWPCAAGRGNPPGRVTRLECIACAAAGIPPAGSIPLED